MSVRTMFGVLVLSLAPGVASAIGTAPLPEPGVIELLAIGGVVAAAIAIRKRQK